MTKPVIGKIQKTSSGIIVHISSVNVVCYYLSFYSYSPIYATFGIGIEEIILLSVCGFIANRSREGCRFSWGGVIEVHVMLLVIVYHESFNIQKVKIRFAECCVQCNVLKYLRSSVHRAATAGFPYFGIQVNDIIIKNQRKTKSISLFP
jgi:hypothetical protein